MAKQKTEAELTRQIKAYALKIASKLPERLLKGKKSGNKKLNFRKMGEGEALYSLGARPAEKNGKKGLTLGGLFIEASDDKPGAIVAGGNKKHTVKGSKKSRCHDCGRKVWLAPNGQEMHRRYPDVPVICIFCMMKRAESKASQRV